MANLHKKDILQAFKTLNITGKKIVTHCSFKSFGHVEWGVETIHEALMESFVTILMAGFTYNAKEPPPDDDRPAQNGCIYSELYPDKNFSGEPFLIEQSKVHRRIGIVSQLFSLRDDVVKSDHPMHSWLAWGQDATYLTENHPWDKPYLPLERLEQLGGYVALIGVDLFPCTAIHVAEERAGRKPFIRWARDRDNNVRIVKTGGCADWFNNLLPFSESVFKSIKVGPCFIRTAKLDSLIRHFVSLILSRPDLTICQARCIRCTDALKGGPLSDIKV